VEKILVNCMQAIPFVNKKCRALRKTCMRKKLVAKYRGAASRTIRIFQWGPVVLNFPPPVVAPQGTARLLARTPILRGKKWFQNYSQIKTQRICVIFE